MREKVQMTADIIIVYDDGEIVLTKRKYEPFKDFWSLPGGKMENEEMLEITAVREAKEETGLDIMITRLIGVYSDPFRDPRGRYISVAYEAKIIGGELKPGSDAASCIKIAIKDIGDLAFDHNKIVEDYISSKKINS